MSTYREDPAVADARDAALWRKLMGVGRVRVLGSAGLGTDRAHIGVEFTLTYPKGESNRDENAREWFLEFVHSLPTPEVGQ